ncbi:MAG: cell wall hydrolase [Alphaproteobacteria bacterium]|jgi:spore germination cell wall hydrolase CwlJ-like protein|nr:cell wall hydrolase [Alphaproteobacteria bacterium]
MNHSVRAAGIAAALLASGGVAAHAAPLQATAIPAAVNAGAQMVPTLADTMRGRPLEEQVAAYERAETDNQEQDCLASAVYFEARGESLEGQLAVAEVVMNRADSGRYPSTLCGVVEQPWQFSFVNATGRIPNANRDSAAWRRAVAVARIAQDGVTEQLSGDCLWYHADYVSPSWGRRLNRVTKIGLHIFYR